MPAQEYNINVTADDGDVDAMRSLIDRFKPIAIQEATNQATAASTSAAQAALYDGVWLDDVATVITDETLSYGPGASGVAEGDYVRTRAEGFSYQVAAEDAEDHHLTTAGGVKVKVIPLWGGASGAIVAAASFGVTVGGATDCKAAYQMAVDFVYSLGGGVVRMPAGDSLLSSGITWRSKVSLKGQGVGVSRFVVDGSAYGMIQRRDAASDGTDADTVEWLEDCVFEDFEMDGAGFTDVSHNISSKGMFMLYLRRCRFNRLMVRNTVGTGYGNDFLDGCVMNSCFAVNCGRLYGVGGVGGGSGFGIGTSALEWEPSYIVNCHAYNCGNYGFFVEDQPDGATPFLSSGYVFGDCYAQGNRIGFGNKGSGGTIYRNCTSRLNTLYGLHLTQSSYNNVIEGGDYSDNGSDGINCDNSANGLRIKGPEVNRNGRHGINVFGPDSYLDALIDPASCRDNTNNGLILSQSGARLTLLGRWHDNGTAGTSGQNNNIRMDGDVVGLDAAPKCDETSAASAPVGSSLRISGLIAGGTINAYGIRGGTTQLDLGSATHTGLAVRGAGGGIENVTSAFSAGGSPYTHTAGPKPETLYLIGGGLAVSTLGQTVITGATTVALPLDAGQSCIVTWTSLTSAKRKTQD